MAKILKYFELPIPDETDWGWKQYLAFIIETLYTTIFPFVAGMLLVRRNELVWVLMLIIPIYFRLKILQKFDKPNKRVYVK